MAVNFLKDDLFGKAALKISHSFKLVVAVENKWREPMQSVTALYENAS